MTAVTRQQPLYLQVRDRYQQMITSGELAPGDRVPSVRDIVAETGVSHQTVVRAMDLLRRDGLITTTQAGSVVAAPPRSRRAHGRTRRQAPVP